MSAPGAILVTGGALRVGAAVSRRLAAEGWTVVAHYKDSREAAEALCAELRAGGARAETAQADLTSEASIDALARQLGARGDWTGLVNSAASFERDSIGDFAFAPAAAQLRLNLIAPVYLTRRFAELLPAGATGVAVNITDQKVFNPNPDFLSYTLSKIALTHATEVLAMALAPRVRVNCVAAGLMLPSGEQTEEQFARVHGNTLLGVGTAPPDVAEAVAYLCKAQKVTGAVLHVDAGQRLVPSARDVMFT